MRSIDKLAGVSVLLLLVSFTFGVLIRITPFPNVSIYPQDIAAAVIFVLIVWISISRKIFSRLHAAIMLFNVFALISLVLNLGKLNINEALISFAYLVRLNFYLSLLLLYLFDFKQVLTRRIKVLFFSASFILVLIGYIQFLFYNNLRNLYYLGWDDHLYRLFSTFLDPNFAGLFFSIFSIFIVGELFSNAKYRVLNTIFLSAALGALLLTYSRTAIVSLLFGVGAFFLLNKKYKILILSIILLFVGIISVSNFSVEGMNPIRIASTEARIESAHRALQIFYTSPVYGVGFNAFRYAQIREGFVDEKKTLISNADSGTDNSFLFILATTGIIGFSLYFNIWRVIVSEVKNNKKNSTVALCIIIAFFIGGNFINALFYTPLMLWIFTYLGLFVLGKKS